MRMVDLIAKKRDGQALTKEEIDFFIQNYTAGKIPDYQASALCMVIFYEDMTDEERANFTMAMANSGDRIDLSAIEGIKVDKHSTGGVGDTTTLILAPLVAALDIPVAKMSGRGLGHTGGTIDKFEAIPNFKIELSKEDFIKQVNKDKVAVVGQSGNLAPADKKLYALRDVTATVDSLSLIASSIMSKKIAAGADAIVLDVKTGAGAFMKTLEDSIKLAQAMVKIGNSVNIKTMAIISDMNQPLGKAIGNSLEVEEAILTLKGEGPEDLEELSLILASQMVVLAGKAKDLDEAKEKLKEVIKNGKAIEKFKTLIKAQGGDERIVDDFSLLPQAKYKIEILAEEEGFVSEEIADELGVAAMLLGAGRATKEDKIDYSVGLVLNKKVGDEVKKGEKLLTIHSNKEEKEILPIIEKIKKAIKISPAAQAPKLVYEIITE